MCDSDNQATDRRSPLVSIVVCTYNRAGLLAAALQSLCEQTLNPSEYKIIVVDNNSSDTTRAVAEEFCRRRPNIRYVFERQQGHSHARNRGWQEARGEYVGYIDDDAQAPPQWLAVAKEVIEEVSPAVFGGPYYASYNSPKPAWWKDSYRSHERTETARPLDQGEYLSGGNIFFRRQLLQTMGGFDVTLGMSGETIGVGEETDLLRRVRATDPEALIYFEPELCVDHLVPAEKMTLGWNMRRRFATARYAYRVFEAGDRPPAKRYRLLLQTVRTLRDFAKEIFFGAVFRNKDRYPYAQNYLYERAFRHLQTLGRLYEQYQHGTWRP